MEFINTLANWLNTTTTSGPFSDLFDTFNGYYPLTGPTFIARPVVGGMFAPLALESAPKSGYVNPT